MANKHTSYIAKPVDVAGIANYTDEENAIWHDLFERQYPIVKNRACDEYIKGVELLNLTKDRIPQCPEVSAILRDISGWSIEPVSALIPFEKFFSLLANRQFPAATFIRTREELDYLKEPDIFHEVFGHCPLLTNQAYADFTENYGKLALKANAADRKLLARLYWFTIEFGLIKSKSGLKIYGGGILSSKEETIYSLESPIPFRKEFNLIEALRTPYKINILQPIYFIIDNFDTLFHIMDMDLISLVHQAHALGELPPAYFI